MNIVSEKTNYDCKDYVALDFNQMTKYLRVELPRYYSLATEYKSYPNCKKVKLLNFPENKDDNSFINTMVKRESIRDFSNDSISLQDLSFILNMGYGINKIRNVREFRTVPSAGARYPLEIYTAIFNCSGIEKGIYHYNIKNNELELIKSGDLKELIYEECYKQEFILSSSMVIIITACFNRTLQKYGERGYRYVFLDAGHVGENIYLSSSYLNLGCVAIGGFDDDKLNDTLGIDGKNESSIYVLTIGKSGVVSFL